MYAIVIPFADTLCFIISLYVVKKPYLSHVALFARFVSLS